MKKALLSVLVLAATFGAALAHGSRPIRTTPPENHALPVILSFDSMYAVEGPLLGEANAIRGEIGDEAPWVITHFIKGRLDKSGHLTIIVHGLVFADDP